VIFRLHQSHQKVIPERKFGRLPLSKIAFWRGLSFTHIQKVRFGGAVVICSTPLILLCLLSFFVKHMAERYIDVLKFLNSIIAENTSLPSYILDIFSSK
jgi:hypothetical protein